MPTMTAEGLVGYDWGLALHFGNCPAFWMNLQSNGDLKMARRKLKPEDARRIKVRGAA
jgi:plasmid maintenance system antidote protein VapI